MKKQQLQLFSLLTLFMLLFVGNVMGQQVTEPEPEVDSNKDGSPIFEYCLTCHKNIWIDLKQQFDPNDPAVPYNIKVWSVFTYPNGDIVHSLLENLSGSTLEDYYGEEGINYTTGTASKGLGWFSECQERIVGAGEPGSCPIYEQSVFHEVKVVTQWSSDPLDISVQNLIFTYGIYDATPEDEELAVTDVLLYPNPTSNTTHYLDYSLNKEANILIQLFTDDGILFNDIVNQTQDAGDYTVDFITFAHLPGIYNCIITATDPETGDIITISKRLVRN